MAERSKRDAIQHQAIVDAMSADERWRYESDLQAAAAEFNPPDDFSPAAAIGDEF